MKLLAVVSSYFPDLNELEKNIQSYLSDVDKLIIWENTPKDKSNITELTKKINSPKIEIRTTGENEFLARPFNLCINWARENDYTHILTMDQDSCFADKHFEKYIQRIKNCNENSIFIFAPHIDLVYNFTDVTNSEIVEVDRAITSGAVYSLPVFDKIGMFREDFLIDAIDTEISMRGKTNGFKIVCVVEVKLIHKSGNQKKTKFGLTINNYSAQRTYYMLRNHLIAKKTYPTLHLPNFYKHGVFYRLAKIFLEDNSLRKLKAIFLGLFHGYSGRAGKYEIK